MNPWHTLRMNPWHKLRREVGGAVRSLRYDLARRAGREVPAGYVSGTSPSTEPSPGGSAAPSTAAATAPPDR